MNKLDSIEEKIEKFLLRLGDIKKLVSLLRCEVNSSKEKQADLQRVVDEVKDSVNCAQGRTDALELKSYKCISWTLILKKQKEIYGKKENSLPRGIQYT